MMLKYSCAILIVSFLWNSLADTKNIILSTQNLRKLNENWMHQLLIPFMKTCNSSTKKTIIFNEFTPINDIHDGDGLVLAFNSGRILRMTCNHQFDDLHIDTVIITVKTTHAWSGLVNFFRKWPYNWDCVIYIFPVKKRCTDYKEVFNSILKFYFLKVYFLCLQNKQVMNVYTHDPYGDTGPKNWEKLEQSLVWGKYRTLYKRTFSKGSDLEQLCQGFDFKRTDSIHQSMILAVRKYQIPYGNFKDEDKLLTKNEGTRLSQPHKQRIINIKKLLGVEVLYYLIKTSTNKVSFVDRAYDEFGVDGLVTNMFSDGAEQWDMYFPTAFEQFAIISHNRGPLTPLEKIVKYYGKWTLISLILILMIAFLVMWFSTRKLHLAFFNIIRLLINSEIITPLEKGSLKLLFCMIFLYFLIIHATFSGHLAEFLTKIEYKPNIETPDDLANPRIHQIYNFGYHYEKNDKYDVLQNKTTYFFTSTLCEEKMSNPNHACIAPLIILDTIRQNRNDTNNILYISKERFRSSLAGYYFRPGFPLKEKINWALIVLFETQLISRKMIARRERRSKYITKQNILNEVKYRPITYDDLHFAFIFLIVGNSTGLLCFFFEMTLQNHFKKLNIYFLGCKDNVAVEVLNGPKK